jgi:hypothetical protein
MYIDNLNNLEILGWLIQTSTRERLHLTKYISGKCPGVSIVVTFIVCSRWWQVGAVVLLHHVHVGNNATTGPHQGGPVWDMSFQLWGSFRSCKCQVSVFPRVSSVDEMQTFRWHIDSRWYKTFQVLQVTHMRDRNRDGFSDGLCPSEVSVSGKELAASLRFFFRCPGVST